MFYRLAADAVVIMHLGYVLFVIFGLVCVLIGRLCNWSWVRNTGFRTIHLLMILIVVLESLMSITCPLTTLESYFRGKAGQTVADGTFVGKLAHELLFINISPDSFIWIYCGFGAAVLLSWLVVPPNCFMKSDKCSSESSPKL